MIPHAHCVLVARAHCPCSNMPLFKLTQAWDGHNYKDRNEDLPLLVPRTLLRAGRNRISISSADPQSHIAVLVLTEAKTVAQIVEGVRRDHTLMPSAAAAHMKATFGTGADPDDDDIVAGPARLPLTCPLTHTRLTLPARGVSCRHLECFDLEAYVDLAKTTSHPRWTCPLCAAPARPHQLRVDSWLANVLEVSPPDRAEVEVQPDGSFGAVPERPLGGAGGSSRDRKRKAAAAALEIDDANEPSGGSGGGGGGGGGSCSSGGGGSSSSGESSGSGGTHAGVAAAMQELVQTTLGAPAVPHVAVESIEVLEVEQGDDADHPIELSDDDE